MENASGKERERERKERENKQMTDRTSKEANLSFHAMDGRGARVHVASERWMGVCGRRVDVFGCMEVDGWVGVEGNGTASGMN